MLMRKQMAADKAHKYKVSQFVRLSRTGFSDRLVSSGADYEVTRLLPPDQSGEFTYRIKANGFSERAVRESEIVARALLD